MIIICLVRSPAEMIYFWISIQDAPSSSMWVAQHVTLRLHILAFHVKPGPCRLAIYLHRTFTLNLCIVSYFVKLMHILSKCHCTPVLPSPRG